MATRSIQIKIHSLSEKKGCVDIEISVSDFGNSESAVNVSSYTIKVTRPEPVAGFEELLARHIEKYALQEPFETRLAGRVENAITDYGEDLYNQIRLGELLEKLEDIDTLPPVKKLDLCVFEEPNSIVPTIHWEILELVQLQELHPNFDIHVSRVPTLASTTPSEKFEARWASKKPEGLNILVVVSRPKGKQDIPYRNITLPLANISNAFSSQVLSVDIVRLGTWDAVQNALAAKPFGHYHFIHFDVHGYVEKSRAFLRFESSGSLNDDIKPEDVATLLGEHGVKAAILNSCRSAQKPALVGPSIASALIHHGLDFVIGMSYDIHQDAAQYFLEELYKALLVGNLPILEAVSRGRKAMQSEPARRGRFGIKVDVQDWINPVLYLRSPILGQLPIVSKSHELVEIARNTSDWCASFFGRDYDIACIEKALCSGTVARLRGFRGAGKSTLVKHLQEWWIRSNFAQTIFVVDFSETDYFTAESPKISPTEIFTEIDNIITERQQSGMRERKLYRIGPMPSDATSKNTMLDGNIGVSNIILRLKAAFSQSAYIILFNSFDNVSSIPYTGDFRFQPWAKEMLDWFKNLDWVNWQSMVLFSSTLDEDWLNKIPAVLTTNRGQKTRRLPAEIIDLEGLDPGAATRFAEGVINLTPYMENPASRLYLERILQYYQYQPLALKVVLPHLRASNLSTKQYFERTLCSEIEISLEDTGEQKRPLMDIMLASMAASGAIPVPILAATTAYCPRIYLLDILKGDGPFQAEEDPSKAFEDEIDTYKDFGLVRYTEPSTNSENPDSINAGHLLIHPLFTSYMRGVVSEMSNQGGLEPIDITFAYLVYYLAQRSDDWEEIDGFGHPGSIEINRNWFNILAALRYCVIRPYGWDQNTERLFDFLMNRIVAYAAYYKQDSWDIIAEVAINGIIRVMKHFSKSNNIAEPWWIHLHLSDGESVDQIRNTPRKHFPLWLLERMIKLYAFLQFYAYRKFDSNGWYYNSAIIGLLNLKQAQGYPHGDGAIFLEQQAFIAAAEIAHQNSSHYEEGLAYLAKVDLGRVSGPMRQHLEIRQRDILAELMGFILDAESYQGDVEEEPTSHGVIPKHLGEEKHLSRPMRALETRKVYEKALRTKDEGDIEIAKKSIYQALDSLEDPIDPYTIVLHRFMGELFRIEKDWNAAIRQLCIVQEFIKFSPGAFEGIVNENGRDSYLIELHQAMTKCYSEMGDKLRADNHRKISQRIHEEREKTWTSRDAEEEAALNVFYSLQIAFQRANLGDPPKGWKCSLT
ncbi:hypothetical protein AOL_s00080g402 [Orbilia oligospora ATCC 24927]|uniref:CHAT domain-containing protein n=1 Tax=Arthrobotrys oligospora (strain ATCC 24927 / CBS 115.81 / DSM 1491) TaxID=756982 RepID=G1XF17_ARTOA|nr:hypothetical protein AOL_s00080g402 [Orbilia oligospora ATCC 24927]EGX48277.1 hypothetical protein AOL_s00080g402 [Orbilia oligospora ATCC 24927]